MYKLTNLVIALLFGLLIAAAPASRAVAQVQKSDIFYFFGGPQYLNPRSSQFENDYRYYEEKFRELGDILFPRPPSSTTKKLGRRARIRADDAARRAAEASRVWDAYHMALNGLMEGNEAHFNRGRRSLASLRWYPLARELLSYLPKTFVPGFVFLTEDGKPVADPDAFIRSRLMREKDSVDGDHGDS